MFLCDTSDQNNNVNTCISTVIPEKYLYTIDTPDLIHKLDILYRLSTLSTKGNPQ